jgi:hypothetical protein
MHRAVEAKRNEESPQATGRKARANKQSCQGEVFFDCMNERFLQKTPDAGPGFRLARLGRIIALPQRHNAIIRANGFDLPPSKTGLFDS